MVCLVKKLRQYRMGHRKGKMLQRGEVSTVILCYTGIFSELLNLYCVERRNIRRNIAWAQGKSRGQSTRDFPRAEAIFYRISRLQSQYRPSLLQLQHWISWRSILEKLIFRIAPTAGQYGKISPSRLSNTGELNFNIIMLSNWECTVCVISF